MVRWQNGDVADCKSAYVGSIPARTSIFFMKMVLPKVAGTTVHKTFFQKSKCNSTSGVLALWPHFYAVFRHVGDDNKKGRPGEGGLLSAQLRTVRRYPQRRSACD